MTRHEKTMLMYAKYTYSYYGTYLLYCLRYSRSVSCIRFPMKSCINDTNCIIGSYYYLQLKPKNMVILCAHKALFSDARSHMTKCVCFIRVFALTIK